ncbi:MAG: EAL domain-containing protein [Lachnospiraceae bacterium]|nr:EAL domain-containing protein [Lachnospiraceae bacterium]
MRENFRKGLLVSSIVCYFVYTISTIIGDEFVYSLFCALTTFQLFLLTTQCIKDIGRFAIGNFIISMGIFFYFLADFVKFINQFILGIEPISLVVRTLYVMPNYFFGASVVIWFYVRYKERPREFSYLLINTFCFAMAAIVVTSKVVMLLSNGHYISKATQLRAGLYFFINFSIFFLIMHVVYMVGLNAIRKGTNLLTLGILFYVLLDFYYSFLEATGAEAENPITNLLYVGFMGMMAIGVYIQITNQYDFPIKEHDYSAKGMKTRFACAGVIIIIDIIMGLTGFLGQSEVMYIVVAILTWVIMSYVLNNGYLDEKLLTQQKKQNIILEELVKEKTKDLLEANRHLEEVSATDTLTGLYNRRYSRKFISQLTEMARKNNSGYAIFCIDLNNFKPINDTYGHDMGDAVLAEFGNRLKKLPGDSTAFRTGGDEFMVICNNVFRKDDVTKVGESLQRLFREPVRKDSYVFQLSGSIGSATYPGDCKDSSLLMQYADAAMYTVKHSKHKDGYRAFDLGLVQVVGNRRRLSNVLSVAEPRDFQLFYQPEVYGETGKLYGMEVFPHLKGDMENVSPNELIPIMEEVGLMTKIGTWIFYSSISAAKEWEKDLGFEPVVNINLSPLQLVDTEFISKIKQMTEDLNMSPDHVVLDVANEVIMGASHGAKETLKKLKEDGFILSLNDFGGGDINLSYVIECDFDILKLSRELVNKAEKDEDARKLILSIIAVARGMNLEVVAVGVENKAQADMMRELNIEKMQGYYFGMPLKQKGFEKTFVKPD